MHESQGSEAGDLAMPFRYEVVPDQTKITNTFRPNSMGPNFDPETHKPATLGCAFMGQLHRVARQQQNDKIAVLWEARPRASNVTGYLATASFSCARLTFPVICQLYFVFNFWQVSVQSGASTPKIVPVKPKVYLTCSITAAPQTWLKLTG